ncbi:MAG: AraC family transcriptional regulator [Hungatella sp.]|nr:AraC family transcriptional regulator [Hungatella sp.]
MDKGYYEVNRMRENYPVKIVPHQKIVDNIRLDNGHILKHWHRSVEIFLMYNGSCMLWKNGMTRKMETGDIEIINSEEAHEYYNFSDKRQDGCTIVISYIFLKETFGDIDNVYFLLDNKNKGYQKLMDVILQMKEIYNEKEDWYNLKIKSAMYELIYILMKYFRIEKNKIINAKSQKYQNRYKEIITYMNGHYMENILLNDVAKTFGFNSEYFSRSFKKYIGINFKDFLKELRINAGKKLLIETDKTITEIALEIGEPDAKSFIRDFKKEFKTTPLKYRKMINE